MNSLPKTVTRQRRGCNLNQGPSAPESNTLPTRLPSHPKTPLINGLIFKPANPNLPHNVGHVACRRQSQVLFGKLAHVVDDVSADL